MIKSMTGFGRGETSDGKRHITVEIKSVNHRYSDITVKMPRRYTFAEEKIKNAVKEIAKRGKIDVSVMVDNLTDEDTAIRLNTAMARQYYNNLMELKEEFKLEGTSGNISLQFLAGLPEVIKAIPETEDEEAILNALLIPTREAAKGLDEMRIREGEKLAEDLIMRGGLIEDMVNRIEAKAPMVVENYTQKLKDRIQQLVGEDSNIPEDRILVEAAIFADKCNITEELVRLKSHVAQLRSIIKNSNQPDGKKLDFLVQEMNREANTIGSKANDLEITETMLELKSEIEKIREQVQNIE